ncbi:MAG: CPBP family intramembrane glutamic endopeptidase, partial [Candidatus Methanoperedens sp.]
MLGLLGVFGLQLFLAAPVALIDQPKGGNFSTAGTVALQVATAISFLVVPLLVASRGGATVRTALDRLGVRSFRHSAALWMVAAVVAYLVFAAAYSALFGPPKQKDIAEGFGAVPVQVLLIVVAAPISEELCFRGMLFGGLRRRLPRIAAALI